MKLFIMKKDKNIRDFIEGLEMTILPQEEQLLLENGGLKVSGINLFYCPTTNTNCNGGNCVAGCGQNG
jgi:hypothetical protein